MNKPDLPNYNRLPVVSTFTSLAPQPSFLTHTQGPTSSRHSMKLPFMDDFKFDAFRLDDAFEASVVAVNIEFKLFFKLWTAGVLYCAGFVPLGLLLHTQMNASRHSTNPDSSPQTLCTLQKPYHAGKRKLKLHTGVQIIR